MRRSARVYDAQCTAPGSTFSFDIKGGLAEAFACLNRLQIFKLAVSLGGTESARLPSRHHHALRRARRTSAPASASADATIRLSIGIEHPDDLVADLAHALVGDSERDPRA